MPDIDPAALSRTGSGLLLSATPITSTKPLPNPTSSQKTPKSVTMGQRIDYEPIYTALKAAIGEHWSSYREAFGSFLFGRLNQAEFTARTDDIFGTDIYKKHLHNRLIVAMYANVTRDLPDQPVASFVSANDMPTNVSKPVSGDAAEQRLRMEIMQLPLRDRRRLKDIPESESVDVYADVLANYQLAKTMKVPMVGPASAGGMNKTNLELEIRKRYAQPLASETGEFPDAESIQNRMLPICYEEGLAGGPSDGIATFVALATESYIKELLCTVFERTRSNGPNYIMTAAYKRQLEKEEAAFGRGELQRNNHGLLPVEQAAASRHRPLSLADFCFALRLGGLHASQMPLTVHRFMDDYLRGETGLDDEIDPDEMHDGDNLGQREDGDRASRGGGTASEGSFEDLSTLVDDIIGYVDPDEMQVDEPDVGWEGATLSDQRSLGALLDDCLAIGLR